VANLSKTLPTNFYQNRSTFAEVMHKSILVCFLCPTVYAAGLHHTNLEPNAAS